MEQSEAQRIVDWCEGRTTGIQRYGVSYYLNDIEEAYRITGKTPPPDIQDLLNVRKEAKEYEEKISPILESFGKAAHEQMVNIFKEVVLGK